MFHKEDWRYSASSFLQLLLPPECADLQIGFLQVSICALLRDGDANYFMV